MRGEAIIASQHYRFKPEFTGSIFPLYMNVSRFVTVKTVKEKTVRALNIPYGRHELYPRYCPP
jgi:hypothetical protein